MKAAITVPKKSTKLRLTINCLNVMSTRMAQGLKKMDKRIV